MHTLLLITVDSCCEVVPINLVSCQLSQAVKMAIFVMKKISDISASLLFIKGP